MKRRVAWALVIVVVLFVAYSEGKSYVFRWYADNYIERPSLVPSSERPDGICLTWSGDPRTSQSVQWRTALSVDDGWVEFQAGGAGAVEQRPAGETVITDDMVKNDPAYRRYEVTLTGLQPGTEYRYRVGSKEKAVWSEWERFTTAPDAPKPFSFVYMGDVQVGIDSWKNLLQTAAERFPEAAFYIVAGDLVNNGRYRNEWDAFFGAGQDVFERRPLVPVLGNHDYAKQSVPRFYLDLLALPENGPKNVPSEHAYSFRYGNVLFVALDSNRSPEEQAPWLEEQLKSTDATWKIAIYHHPAYCSSPNRDNDHIVESWGALFDKYHVDMALQGHDHAYLRTYPMRGGQRAKDAAGGTYYAVSVAGTKYYDQEAGDYAEVAFPDTSTYQILSVGTDPDVLTYRAYDSTGQERDAVVIRKGSPSGRQN